MELDQVKKFVELVRETDIEELHWENGTAKVSFRRSKDTDFVPSLEKKNNNKPEVLPNGEQAKDENLKTIIKSPIVGTFYRSLPDRPPLVMEGDHITPGQKIAMIETMKIIKDVVSNVKGKITKILVENGKPVEYGKDLFAVEPSDIEPEKEKS